MGEHRCEVCGEPLLDIESIACSEKCYESLKLEAEYEAWANKEISGG